MNFYSEVRNNYDELAAELGALQLIYGENQAAYRREKLLSPDVRVEKYV